MEAERLKRLKEDWARFAAKNATPKNLPPIPEKRQDQESDLWKMWLSIGATAAPEDKLKVLSEMASRQYRQVFGQGLRARRRKFNKQRSRLCWVKNCPCFVCGAPATDRHHVIPLHKGGHNHKVNMVPLCEHCHIEIHPWMAK